MNNFKIQFFDWRSIAFAQAEARAEFAERSVQKLQKEVDRLEGAYTTKKEYLYIDILIIFIFFNNTIYLNSTRFLK